MEGPWFQAQVLISLRRCRAACTEECVTGTLYIEARGAGTQSPSQELSVLVYTVHLWKTLLWKTIL